MVPALILAEIIAQAAYNALNALYVVVLGYYKGAKRLPRLLV